MYLTIYHWLSNGSVSSSKGISPNDRKIY